MKTKYQDITPYITKDGSVIRELMHPDIHGNRYQSLAEAIVAPGQSTSLHIHYQSEELYHITRGRGTLRLSSKLMEVSDGDTVCIHPGVAHQLINTGSAPLKLLCCCVPPYSHEDTELLADEP